MSKLSSLLVIVMVVGGLLSIPQSCEQKISDGEGLLEGKISIGPLCPVETDPPSPDCAPTAETYKAYPVGIWTFEGQKLVREISPALDGSFSIKLVPGKYLLKLDREYSAGGSNLPASVEINSDDITTINVSIDTGIR